MQYTPKLKIHGETPEKTLDLHGFYMFDTAEKCEEYSSSWHRTPDSAAAPQIWLQTSPVLTCEPGLPSRRSMENIILDQCSYEAVHMAGPKRFLHAANHETDLAGVKMSMDTLGRLNLKPQYRSTIFKIPPGLTTHHG